VELLTEFDFEQAQQFASEIEQYNSDRKDLDKQITKTLLQIEVNEEKRPLYLSCLSKLAQRRNWCRFLNRKLQTYSCFTKVVINMRPRHDQSKVLTSIMHSKPARNI
jgi:single-stranded DNA-specific DHH superfamily exonuclease